MLRALIVVAAMLPGIAAAQFTSGQKLTAAGLNSALAAPTITGGTVDGAPIGATTPAAASFTGMNAAYNTTYAPGSRAPIFVWQNPNGSTAAGYNAGQQIWIGNNPTATPAAGDTVASTMGVVNGNNRSNLWGQNLLVGICGTAEGCSTSDYINSPVTGQEIDVYGSASWTPANRAFNATSGTYVINGQEIYCQGPQYCTSGLSVWSTAANGSNWFKEGIAINRVSDIGLHFTQTSGDTGTQFGTAAIQDDSNSANVIGVGSGTHTNYFSAPNLQISGAGNILTGARTEVLGSTNYAVIGGASGATSLQLQTGTATGLYCATDGSTYGECMTHNTVPLLLGSNNSAQLTLSTTGVTASVPLTTSSGIVANTTGTDATSTSVGYYTTGTSSNVSVTNSTVANIASISLGAGIWDLQGDIQYVQSAAGIMTTSSASISTTSATNGGLGALTNNPFTASGSTSIYIHTPTVHLVLTGTTTVYLTGSGVFSSGTVTANGFIRALRTH